MVAQASLPRAWLDAFRPACRARGLRFVSGEGFTVDDNYIASIRPAVFHPGKDRGWLRVDWEIVIKPLAVDEILWAAFLPDVEMGKQMRINRRINGAFHVQPLRLAKAGMDLSSADRPDWGPVLEDFDRMCADFIAAHQTPAGYVAALEKGTDRIADNRDRTRMITALMAAGRNAEAGQLADEAIARGESGGMASRVDVLKYLAAYAKGPEAYSAFVDSLIPTHDYQVLYEAERTNVSGNLSRAHHCGRMRQFLTEMNGTDPWAVTLSARPPHGAPDDLSTLRYIQAAGTSTAMVVELCQPGGSQIGAGSVRSVIGHRHTCPDKLDVEIILPRTIETVAQHEVFTAAEAADVFESFYLTDFIGDQYVLRPVEVYNVDGGPAKPLS
ncbi:hypothetical protein [Mycobacteroides abscessus]|uniref:hypothetical protein n=1 Tax=Mycobacteroides abscessus TaxID=36809 RepID=UPI0009D27211|nr:hypothetical protein [Mycobacteroides abscessus]SLC83879.1 Uncharacterised protein [Mycobacteroides abscessus subsp. massiliense]SLJ57674.1 Uncharacterised protein [Mycobacteroides abscessus subsp. abscessus]